jgi:hypothetical protein
VRRAAPPRKGSLYGGAGHHDVVVQGQHRPVCVWGGGGGGAPPPRPRGPGGGPGPPAGGGGRGRGGGGGGTAQLAGGSC